MYFLSQKLWVFETFFSLTPSRKRTYICVFFGCLPFKIYSIKFLQIPNNARHHLGKTTGISPHRELRSIVTFNNIVTIVMWSISLIIIYYSESYFTSPSNNNERYLCNRNSLFSPPLKTSLLLSFTR